MHLSTDRLLENHSMHSRSGGRIEVFYDALDLGPDIVFSSSSWSSYDTLALGLNSGDSAIVSMRAALPPIVTPLRPQRLVDTLLSGFGLSSKASACAVLGVAHCLTFAVAVAEDCSIALWDCRAQSCLDRRPLERAAGRLHEGVIIRSRVRPRDALVVVGFAVDSDSGSPRWRVALLTVDDFAAPSAAKCRSLARPKTLAEGAVLKDLLLTGSSCVAVWSDQGRNRFFLHDLADSGAADRELGFEMSARLEDLRVEDETLIRLCATGANAVTVTPSSRFSAPLTDDRRRLCCSACSSAGASPSRPSSGH